MPKLKAPASQAEHRPRSQVGPPDATGAAYRDEAENPAATFQWSIQKKRNDPRSLKKIKFGHSQAELINRLHNARAP